MTLARRITFALWACAPSLACHTDDGSPGQAASTGDGSSDGSSDAAAASSGGDEAGTSDAASGSSSGELPSPYSDGTTGAPAQPMLSGEAATAALGDGLLAFLHAAPAEIITAYAGLVPAEVFEPGCPETQQFVDGDVVDVMYWATPGCTTAAGVSFSGATRLQISTGLVEDARTIDRYELSSEGSSMRIETPDGRWFSLAGYLALEHGTLAGATDGAFTLIGDIGSDPETAGDNAVLSGSLLPQGYLYGYTQTGYNVLVGSGSITGDGLGDAVAISFSDATIASTPCALEPAGTFAVRDREGYWHDLVFDAAGYDGQDYQWDGVCDGCGSHVAAGEVADDEACIAPETLEALLDWEVVPW